jgi:hypothetical protein
VIAITVHLTPPLASTPALFVGEEPAALEDEVLEPGVPRTPPWTTDGATVPATFAAACWYIESVFDPSVLKKTIVSDYCR